MSSSLIEGKRCPHCGAELPDPKPRACPECMGSLQKRYLTAGCLTTKPLLVLVAWGACELVGDRARADRGPASTQHAALEVRIERTAPPARTELVAERGPSVRDLERTGTR